MSMAISTVTIDEAQVERVLAIEEGHFVDLKAVEVAPSKLTRTQAAFANADGGELFVGIDEMGPSKETRWRGFADQEAANAHVQVFEQLFPLGQDFQYEFLTSPMRHGLV